MKPKRTIMMAGGGTGGHVYPGIALARELEQQSDIDIRWVGTEDRVESWAVPHAGYPIDYLDVQFLKGRKGVDRLKALFRLPKALWDAFRLLRRHKPVAVVGLGGFVSGPICLVAGLMRKNVYLLEQNAHAGWTNRINGLVATRVFATFEASRQYFPEKKVEVLGNPIRPGLVESVRAQKAARENEGADRPLGLLVVGGSQGSQTLNTQLPKQLRALHSEGLDFAVRHASGKGRASEVMPEYKDAGFDVEVIEYIDDMDTAYAWADVLVCRAGATTISELSAIGLPALYVPFPFAADDHQSANAQSMVDANAGWMISDQGLGTEQGLDLLRAILSDRDALSRVSHHAQSLGRDSAGADIAARILEDIQS